MIGFPAAKQVVADCNSAMQATFDSSAGSVDHLNWKVRTWRLDHTQCRKKEVEVVDDWDGKCRLAQNIAVAAGRARPPCACEDKSDKKERLMKKVET